MALYVSVHSTEGVSVMGMQAVQAQQSRREAHFHTAHLLAIMTKLMPEWLPEDLFSLLLKQWNSNARRARLVLPLAPRAQVFFLNSNAF